MIKKNSITLLVIFFPIFSISNCYCYGEVSVGDSYGGGTVFCVSQTPDITQCVPVGSGKHGLIMANVDQANLDSPRKGVHWSSVKTAIPGGRSADDGLGNTCAIIAALPRDNAGNNAAWLCYNYPDPGGPVGEHLTAWYLPSKNCKFFKHSFLFLKNETDIFATFSFCITTKC